MVLESGSAHAHVVHRDGARWDVEAGPFDVHVVGTAFEVGWDPVRELFTLSLEQGRVAVSGCSLPAERTVAAGETFQATCRDGRFHVEPTPSSSATTSAESPDAGQRMLLSPPASVPRERNGAPPLGVSSLGPPRNEATSAPRWEEFAASGRYEDAIDAAEAQGLSAIKATADVAKLMTLADAARFAGRTESATRILRWVRDLYPLDARASVAAFHLGRIAFDRGAFGESLVWFHIYLDERPSGALAREAAGRVIEALQDSGNMVGARQAAKRYLESFPDGPHADLARSLVIP